MRFPFSLVFLLALAATAQAQAQTTIVPGSSYFLEWDQADADAPTFSYVLTIDSARQAGQTAICVDHSTATAPLFTCQLPFPAITPGRHLIAVIATVTVNGTTLESAPSDPVDVQLKPVPGKPGGFRVVIR